MVWVSVAVPVLDAVPVAVPVLDAVPVGVLVDVALMVVDVSCTGTGTIV